MSEAAIVTRTVLSETPLGFTLQVYINDALAFESGTYPTRERARAAQADFVAIVTNIGEALGAESVTRWSRGKAALRVVK